MKQLSHLLIVNGDRRAALVAIIGPRWLLPVVTCSERARGAPLVARWCAERGIAADVVGQWLGRVTADAIDWLVAIVAAPDTVVSDSALEWRALDGLLSNPSVLEYQAWAVARALVRGALPSVEGPFGNLSWPDDVRTWIAEAMGSTVTSLTPYRVGAYEVVLDADCAGGRVYFKGLAGERATEPRLTQELARMAPESFARTLAMEPREDGTVWWLTAACPGLSGGNAHGAAGTLARLQQRVFALDALPDLTALDLEAAATWAGELLGESPVADVVRQQCARVMSADVPATWIPMDLDPSNVLIDDDGRVRFIDVDDSFLGPAPLAVTTLALRSACGARSARGARPSGRAIYRTWELAWSSALTGLDWVAFETASIVVQSWLGWRRLERHIARGEVYVDRDLAAERTRQRLTRAIGAVWPCRSRPDDPAV